MAKHTLTLSRWHKVVERVNSAVKEKTTNITTTLGNTRVQGFSGQVQIEELDVKAQKARDQIAEVILLVEDLVVVREALASANVANKVNGLVSLQDALAKQVSLIRGVLSQQTPEMVAYKSLSEYKSFEVTRGYREESGIKLSLLSQPEVESLEQQLAAIQARLNSLADELADINAAKLEITVSDRISAIAGLS